MNDRIYIDSDEVRITRSALTKLDVEFFVGEKLCSLEPRRLFPRSGLTKYISLIDEKGNERAVIRDIEKLIPDSAKAVRECLDEYYFIPKITALLDRKEKYAIITWKVMTDRGECEFEVRNTSTDIKILYDGRTLIRDSNDNRYEIEDIEKLDKHSKALLSNDI